jgi:hypothetical protein
MEFFEIWVLIDPLSDFHRFFHYWLESVFQSENEVLAIIDYFRAIEIS